MGPRPDGLTIERIDNDRHYSCGHCDECKRNGWALNCRWDTRLNQANNKRSNVNITFNGQTKSCGAWSREMGLPSSTVIHRIKNGWSVEKAITTPLIK